MSKPHHHKCVACSHIWQHAEPTHGFRSSAQFNQYHTCPKCDTNNVDAGGGCDKVDAQGNPTAPKLPARYDVASAIIDYESGTLEQDAAIEFFQHLVDSGLAWQLQGHYGRTAANLIAQGYVRQGN